LSGDRFKLENIRAVVLDWAGTTIDYGCCAPPRVFREVFQSRGVEVSERQARGPMGMAKWEHIQAIANNPEVRELWIRKYGLPATKTDIDFLFKEFVPLQKEILSSYSQLIPGTVDVIDTLRSAGVAIGSTTGYTHEHMEVVLPLAAKQGYKPDTTICSDDVSYGRPRPWMHYEALKRLNVDPVWQTVKVDDTPVGIQAGQNAGAWTVAVCLSGNEIGLSYDAVRCLGNEDRAHRIAEVKLKFKQLGTDFIIDTVADLPPVMVAIDQKIANGELPSFFSRSKLGVS